MKVGLFLDVDGVCTREAVNLQYARLLGIEKEHQELENRFSTNQITTADFGIELVNSFRDKGFTKEWVTEHRKDIKTRINAEALLHIFEDVYIVSSAPNYFIDQYAKEHGIPEDRIIRSEYIFDNDGLICECACPVSDGDKADFVAKVAEQYDVLIGVGDVYEQDQGFLTNCNIRILMNEYRPGYLSINELASAKSLLENLKGCIKVAESSSISSPKFADVSKASHDLLVKYPYHKNVFIMTPFREDDKHREMIDIIKAELADREYKGWIAKDRVLNNQLWLNVEAFMLSCKYGIAIFTASEEQEGDITQLKGKVYNPNVSIELGFMLSRGKEVLILKDKKLEKLPTDMMGSLYEDFDLQKPEDTLPLKISKWINNIRKKQGKDMTP